MFERAPDKVLTKLKKEANDIGFWFQQKRAEKIAKFPLSFRLSK